MIIILQLNNFFMISLLTHDPFVVTALAIATSVERSDSSGSVSEGMPFHVCTNSCSVWCDLVIEILIVFTICNLSIHMKSANSCVSISVRSQNVNQRFGLSIW